MDIPEDLPNEIPWDDIERFDDLDTRVSAINCLFANIIGVNDGYVEWCPNDDPPTDGEYLAWAWVVKPSLGKAISVRGPAELGKLVRAYDANEIDRWLENFGE